MYLIGWEKAPDKVLVQKKHNFMTEFTDPTTITYKANIKNMSIKNLEELSEKMGEYYKLHENKENYGIFAINSNFINISKPGCEKYIKFGKSTSAPNKQGNGSSFNSCIEFVIKRKNEPNVKIYKPKCFPQDGMIQLSGAKQLDLSDAHEVVGYIIELFQNLIAYEFIEGDENMYIDEEKTSLINFKFNLYFWAPTCIIDIPVLQIILCDIADTMPLWSDFEIEKDDEYMAGIKTLKDMLPAPMTLPRHRILDNKMNFNIKYSDKYKIVIKMELGGKYNITSSKDANDSFIVYSWVKTLFDLFWYKLITLILN
jgi:hypothetical protein